MRRTVGTNANAKFPKDLWISSLKVMPFDR